VAAWSTCVTLLLFRAIIHRWRFGLPRCVWAASWCVHPSTRVHMVLVESISFVSMIAHELDGLRAGPLVGMDGRDENTLCRMAGRELYKYTIPCTDESTNYY
jgi:hypothetical protein